MNAEKILIYLSEVSNKILSINLINHIIVYAALVVYFILQRKGKNKSAKLVRDASIVMLFLAVVLVAAINGNPFHLITFSIMLILFVIFQIIGSRKQSDLQEIKVNDRTRTVMMILSGIMIFIGVFYPEFTDVLWIKFFLYAPVGIVPCPTLLTTLGFMNLTADRKDKVTLIAMASLASIYGIIGTFVFHVYLDIALLVLVVLTIVNLIIRKEERK